MTFFGKLGHAFKTLGSKAAGAASYLGHKLGHGLMTLAPAVSVLSPSIGAGFASAGAVASGVGALGDAAKSVLGGNVGVNEFKQGKAAVGQIQAGMQSIKSAYKTHKSGLERG